MALFLNQLSLSKRNLSRLKPTLYNPTPLSLSKSDQLLPGFMKQEFGTFLVYDPVGVHVSGQYGEQHKQFAGA